VPIQRGPHPRSENKGLVQSRDRIAQFDAYAKIDMISPRPLLMVAGSGADPRYFSEEAISKAAEPKELFIIDGGTHIRLYELDEYVTPAVVKLNEVLRPLPRGVRPGPTSKPHAATVAWGRATPATAYVTPPALRWPDAPEPRRRCHLSS
jgi:fermentation-respiration switch protein FrsA (DUF1100 family)